MFTFKDIKPIPKYIEKLIYNRDKKHYNFNTGNTRFYSYLTRYKDELAQVYVAARNYKKQWYCKQVAIHFVNAKKECAIKDIAFFYAAGYVVGWYEQGITKYQKNFEGDWDLADDKYFNMYAPVVNQKYALKIKRYKYSAVDLYNDTNIIKYLRIYEKYPQSELLLKLGFGGYATSKMLLAKIGRDKKFQKWLISHRSEIMKHYYYVSTILLAYKANKSLELTQRLEEEKKTFCRRYDYQSIKPYMPTNEIHKSIEYMKKQNIGVSSYSDYLRACDYLHLDLSLPKNRYPHEFRKWHDIRIDEYHTAKAEADEKERKELYQKFAKIAEKYIVLQRNKDNDYVAIIARSPKELVYEGEKLHHCVGRMNYDQKFVREESLIFFIRKQNNPNKPFVTVEYSLKNHKVLQCYGDRDSRPANEVLEFVNKTWLPYANRKLKKIA